MPEGWYPDSTVEQEGERSSEDPLPPGVVGSDGEVTLEVLPVADDLAGHWRITIRSFCSFDFISEQSREIHGPWVLEFDVPETP